MIDRYNSGGWKAEDFPGDWRKTDSCTYTQDWKHRNRTNYNYRGILLLSIVYKMN